MKVNLNGNIINEDEPTLFTSNRSFRYGDGLFESIRVFEGHIPFMEQHWHRLSAGCSFLKFEVPSHFTQDFFLKEIAKLTLNRGNWRIRISVWRSAGGFYTPNSNIIAFLIEAIPLPSTAFVLNETGIKTGIYSGYCLPQLAVNTIPSLANFKTTSALPFVLASIFKKENNWDDCLLLNSAGRLACGTSSNIFLVKKNVLTTPPLEEGCVAGTIRAFLLKSAAIFELRFVEKTISLEDLISADEVFLTNAIFGIRWVATIEETNKSYDSKMADLLVDQLNAFVLLNSGFSFP